MTKTHTLNFTREAQQRVLVGLRWDPKKLPFYIRWITPRARKHFDLDLTCYVFNGHGDFTGIVSGEELVSKDDTGAIYHSGDDQTGEFGNDDEQIAIELLNLGEDIHHIIFVVTCKCAHDFHKVLNPAVRLADAKTNESQLDVELTQASEEDNAFLFVRLYRDGESWMVEEINEYLNQDEIDNWPVYLQAKGSFA